MIEKIWYNSIIYRLYKLWCAWYEHSLIKKFTSFMKEQYACSKFKAIYNKKMSTDMESTKSSLLYRFFAACNSLLYKIGQKLSFLVEGSALVGFVKKLPEKKAVKNSYVLSAAFSGGISRFALIIFALYLPLDYVIRNFIGISFLSSLWDELFMIASVFIVVIKTAFSEHELTPRVTPVDVAIILFVGISFVEMLLICPIFSVALDGFRAVVQYMLWFFVVIRLINDETDVKYFYYTFLAVAALVAFHGIYQFIIGVEIPSGWVSATEVGVRTRVFSILDSPNIMGCFMVMAAPMCAAMAYNAKKLIYKGILWGITFVMCVSCLVTFSRGAWIGMAVAIVVFAIYIDRKLIGAMLMAVTGAMFVPQIVNRITYLFTSDFAEASKRAGRAGRWASGWSLLMRSDPLFGFGLGRFGGAVAMQNQTVENMQYFYMDNYYLKILVEQGFVGLFGYVILILTFLYNGMKCVFKALNGKMGLYVVGMFSGMCGVLAHCFFENIFEVPYMMAYFWGMAAIIMWVGYINKDGSK